VRKMSKLDFDNLEGYKDADTYDLLNDLNEVEWKFYYNYAEKIGGPILDVACGTGRFTIPFAEHGFDITGVDLTQEMLEKAKKKAKNLGVDANFIHADARNFNLGRKFSFVFTTGNSFQHFLDRESVDGLLRTIYNHLDENGLFVFETRNPVLTKLAEDPTIEKDVGSWVDEEGYFCNSTYRRSYDHKNQLEYYVFTDRRWKEESDISETTQPFVLRYFFPQELESVLYYNGFILEEMYGNFNQSTFQADSPLMVCVCRKKGG
jgi:ubiquinone/menaquinone biosynthesis C-methylase UbiE